jgi:hypothetical protein
MSDVRRSSREIERDVEQSRSEVGDTVDELKDRFSPEAALEYGANYMRGPGGERFLRAVRDNPLAAMLALAGVGWLLYTASRPQSSYGGRTPSDRDRWSGSDQQRRYGASGPGVMGDWTEEQNLNQPGDPSARITRREVEEAFGQERS